MPQIVNSTYLTLLCPLLSVYQGCHSSADPRKFRRFKKKKNFFLRLKTFFFFEELLSLPGGSPGLQSVSTLGFQLCQFTPTICTLVLSYFLPTYCSFSPFANLPSTQILVESHIFFYRPRWKALRSVKIT